MRTEKENAECVTKVVYLLTAHHHGLGIYTEGSADVCPGDDHVGGAMIPRIGG